MGSASRKYSQVTGSFRKRGVQMRNLSSSGSPLFEEQSKPDNSMYDPINGIINGQAAPITVAEVENAIGLSKPVWAPCPGGLKLSHVKALGSLELAGHFDLRLLLEDNQQGSVRGT